MAVRAALLEARAGWRNAGIQASKCDTAEQVLAEVLNNVVEHAQAGRPAGVIEIETMQQGSGIACNVRDDGVAMPGGHLPKGDPAKIGGALETLPEGGFGWYMIRSLTADLRYERRDGWNRLIFSIA